MKNIVKIREIGDYFLEKKDYERAFYLYSEVYNQIWTEIAIIQNGINNFSREFLSFTIKASIDFRKNFQLSALNSTFLREFDLDLDQMLNEFVFIIFGRLQSIIYSDEMIHKFTQAMIFHEFLLTYNLLINVIETNWVAVISKYTSPILEQKRLKTLLPLIKEQEAKKIIIELAPKLKNTEWKILNNLILDYLVLTNQSNSHFFKEMRQNVQNYSFRYKKTFYKEESASGNNFTYRKYERHEKYEEANYSNYNSNSYSKSEQKENPEIMSEEYKSIYYGQILGLKGKLTKDEVRKHYIKMISLYHPDKVSGLGKELIDLAESKTKEINLAYEWLKKRYNF